MSSARPARSPLAAIGVGVLLLVGANFLGTLLMPVFRDGLGTLTGSWQLLNVALTVPHSAASAVITLGGIYAALTLDRFDRPLLVVAPVVFLVSFAFVAGTGILLDALPTSVQLSTAVLNGLSQTAHVAAVALLVRAVGADTPDATASEPSLAD